MKSFLNFIKEPHSHKTLFSILLLIISLSALIISLLALNINLRRINTVDAFQVDNLPNDNLIINPWFRSLTNNSKPGLDGWTDANGLDADWTLSQKDSNPSPNLLVSGRCNNLPEYCGTAAKLSADDGKGEVNSDAYLYQVVAANPSNTHLKFFTHWVAHAVNPAEVNIYGGNSQSGPWTKVWTPLYQEIDSSPLPPGESDTSALWKEMTSWSPLAEISLPTGYSFYKVEMHVKLPTPDGFKFTGVYFTAVPENVPTPTPVSGETTPTPTPNVVSPNVHIGDLEGLSYRTSSSDLWKALVVVSVHNEKELPVSGVTVSGQWSQGIAANSSCTTQANGTCTVLVEQLPKTSTSVSFTVNSATSPTSPYLSSQNHDSDNDTTGTSITVNR